MTGPMDDEPLPWEVEEEEPPPVRENKPLLPPEQAMMLIHLLRQEIDRRGYVVFDSYGTCRTWPKGEPLPPDGKPESMFDVLTLLDLVLDLDEKEPVEQERLIRLGPFRRLDDGDPPF
jgi:hypothetical protein